MSPQPFRLPLHIRGETAVGAEPAEGGYCARGISALAEGEPLEDVLALVERSCALAGGSHRLALCMAVENACGVQPARAATLVRVLFAEVERIQARLWLLAQLARAFGLMPQLGEALEQREVLFDGLKRATGARMYPAIVVPGGVRADLDLDPLRAALDTVGQGIAAWRSAASAGGPLGRLGAGVGLIGSEQVAEFHLGGLAATGSSARSDLRQTNPYAGYADLQVEWPGVAQDTGDVAARARAAVEDVATSLTLARACFSALGGVALEDPVEVPGLADDEMAAEATIEGVHGRVTVSCALSSDMHVGQLEILTAALDLFDSLEGLVAGRPFAHIPAFLASLDLCMECVDQ